MQKVVELSDLVVVGGGLAGTCAAIAAARLGQRVSLVTNRPMLGGNSSSEIRVWVVGATAHGFHRFARETGIMGELFLENQYRNPEGNPVFWDQVVRDAVDAEPNIALHLNTDVHDLEMVPETERGADGRPRISSVSGWNMQTETWMEFRAPVFADCTGDGLIGALAGATFMQGREGQAEFGEAWAPDEPDREFLGSSMFFYSKDTGRAERFVAPNNARDITQTPILRNRIINTGDNGSAYWWIEWGGGKDTVHDADEIRDELSGVIFGIWNYIKNSGRFDTETLSLEWVGHLAGRREYRRFYGDHVLTQQDVLEQRSFDDAVAYGGWSVDLHPVEGMYAEEPGALQRYSEGPYQIPFRCLYSKDVGNLLLAGRDISATHIAAASSRVMATCATEGQAIGTAASLMVCGGLDNREVARDPRELQQLLLREDGPALGVPRDDPDDLLEGARVSASSHQGLLDTGSTSERIPLDDDLAVVLPADPGLGDLEILVDAAEDTDLELQLWGTGRPQNYLPVDQLASWAVRVRAGESRWVPAGHGDGDALLPAPCNAVLVVRRNPAVTLHLTDRHPYGQMMLRRVAPDQPDELLTAWIAKKDRGRVPVLRSSAATAAYEASRVLDPYQRPFGGPHMWMSRLRDVRPSGGDPSVEEWIELRLAEPREVASLRLILNDDVDADLVNLHHHRTPWAVAPTLLRDYRLEGHRPGTPEDSWQLLAEMRGNRHRHAIHDLGRPTPMDGLRVVVEATNGAPYASIFAIKAYAAPSGRSRGPWR